MSKCKKIDFNDAIRVVMKKRCPTRKLDKKSADLLDTILNDVSRQLVEKFNAEYEASSDTKKLCNLYAQKAVEKTFTGKLKKQAKAESAKQLAMYDTGCLKYGCCHRTTENESCSKITHKRTSTAKFEAYLPKLCPPGPVLSRCAESFLSQHLHQFVGRVVAATNPEESLQPHDLKCALGNFLGPEVYGIACKEGLRALEFHANGYIKL